MLLDLLKERYSCRNFSNKKIPAEIIDYILECGRLSASGGNEQPWKFGVVTDAATIKKLAEAASRNYRQDWVAGAPLVIALCSQLFDNIDEAIAFVRFPSLHERIKAIDNDVFAAVNMEEHQTKIPGEHMVIAALEHGIQSTWISSLDCEAAAEILGVKGYLVSNIIAFGYPARHEVPTAKKELKEIVFYERFG